jgi:hypothetical protein
MKIEEKEQVIGIAIVGDGKAVQVNTPNMAFVTELENGVQLGMGDVLKVTIEKEVSK